MLLTSSRFRRQFKKCSEKIRTKAFERLELLVQNEWDITLNSHKLSGKYDEYRSIDVTGDVRVVYKRVPEGFYLAAIGTHSELYK